MSSTPGYTSFEPQDFSAHSAYIHSKSADGHAMSAIEEENNAYLHHLKAAESHEAAAKAHLKAHQSLPLPENASKPNEGKVIATPHPVEKTPITSKKLAIPTKKV